MTTTENLSLVGIVNGYFKAYNRTPKHNYTEQTVYTVIADAMAKLAGLLNGGATVNDFYVYLNNVANYWGVNVSEAMAYLKAHPDYITYIETTAKNSGYYDNSLGSVLSKLGSGISGGVADFVWGLLKPLIPFIIIILLVVYGLPLLKKYGNAK